MDEEPNEHELEERLYAMLHHVDETQTNVNTNIQIDATNILESAPRSTVRRYWRTGGDNNSPYQKTNAPKDNAPNPTINNTTSNIQSKPKQEKSDALSADLTVFQTPPQIVQKTIEILENESDNSVLLESSDEDEVIEVALPPKPTITIESSDEDEVCIITKQDTPTKNVSGPTETVPSVVVDREVSASPVPSVVSSVSDEFIRSDCIALNISSKHQDNHSFDFSLHGADLLGQVTPSKKKKKKKSKDPITSTPVYSKSAVPSTGSETCFATPKSKAKNKKQKNKSYTVTEKSVPNADIYDSDSNQSVLETNKDQKDYEVTDKSFPSSDVYESDSSQPETVKKIKPAEKVNVTDCPSMDLTEDDDLTESNTEDSNANNDTLTSVVDLTDSNYVTLDSTGITESIVMANVTGFKESEDYGDEPDLSSSEAPKLGSTKVPQILFDNLDFDNLKGKDTICRKRNYSLKTLRAEMEKFYNESWGGEDFNHREIQKYMSRDKSLWMIDPKDRMPSLAKRKMTCNYCNRYGHRDDACMLKPAVCYMCGNSGHYEPRCPAKICVNCGSPNHLYSSMCRHCSHWPRAACAECGLRGHTHTHCPDTWRRYHNTIDENTPLVENRLMKKSYQLHCSGCARRGHLVHNCRVSLPFSGLPIPSPYVSHYRPIYFPEPRKNFPDSTIPKNKRQSQSSVRHDTHVNKKRILSETTETTEEKSPDVRQRKISQGKQDDASKAKTDAGPPQTPVVEKALDFIPIASTNHDKKGQMIQDNEVSDTSDVVTSARIYVPNEIIDKLKTQEGEVYLSDVTKKHNVEVHNSELNSFLSIKGKIADQEAFQIEFRDWAKENLGGEQAKPDRTDREADAQATDELNGIPKCRIRLIRILGKALDSLKNDLGDPKGIFKEVNYLQNRHNLLLKQKVVSPKKLSNNRNHMKLRLKKLNMILLGQAGLGDGSKHLSELYALHEKLLNFRQKKISVDIRKEISQHYHSIFSGVPRDDYSDLVKKYYVAQKKTSNGARKRNRSRKKSKSQSEPQTVEVENVPQNNVFSEVSNEHAQPGEIGGINARLPKPSGPGLPITVGKLAFYHQRLKDCRPAGQFKKTKIDLIRKLHTHILLLHKNVNMSSKTLKKMRKIQNDAREFLNNV